MTTNRRPTRQEAIDAAAEILVDELIRIETDKAIAAAAGDQAPERAA